MLHSFDLTVMAAITAWAGRFPVFERLVGLIHATASLKGGIVAAIMCWLWVEAARFGRAAQRLVVRMVVAMFAAIAVGRAAQLGMPHRVRPILEPGLGIQFGRGAVAEGWEDWSSLPSDHAVYLIAAATVFGFRSRWLGIGVALWMTVLQLLPRIYFGEHYPSDVVAGAAIGVAVAFVVMRLPGLDWIGDLAAWAYETYPPAFCALAMLVLLQMATMFEDVGPWLHALSRFIAILRGSG